MYMLSKLTEPSWDKILSDLDKVKSVLYNNICDICLRELDTEFDIDDLLNTIAARERLEASGIEVVGLGIKMPRIKETIPESEVINNLEDLPKALFGVLQKKLC